ncbi:MAG: glutamate-5-semialdehyde dehydrogenase [Patescibacteria group bacterium]
MKINNLKLFKNSTMEIAQANEKTRDLFLSHLADSILSREEEIIKNNTIDIEIAKKKKISKPMIERLILNSDHIAKIVNRLKSVEKLNSGLGEVIESKETSEKLILKKVRTSIGSILVIYESRPEVTIDVASLCIKSGNSVILKGGSEAKHTNTILHSCITQALEKTGLSKHCVLFESNRGVVAKLLKKNDYIDLVIARGGYKLVNYVMKNSTIPVLAHAAGGARIYIDKSANLSMALKIILNAKTSKTAACNSLDTVVVHKQISKAFIPELIGILRENNVVVFGDNQVGSIVPINKTNKNFWRQELLDLRIGLKIVDNLDEAINFINLYSKKHSEGIVSNDKTIIKKFVNSIDAAAIFVNSSPRLHDGFIFGLGSEMGISTGKLHARGPVGLKELTTYRWEVYGNGHIRK